MPKLDTEKQTTPETEEPSLKGTLVSVIILGLFLLISWFGVWYIFISR